jgi:hypothetical protein
MDIRDVQGAIGKSAQLIIFQYKCSKKVIYEYFKAKLAGNVHRFILHQIIKQKPLPASIMASVLFLDLLQFFAMVSLWRDSTTSMIFIIR